MTACKNLLIVKFFSSLSSSKAFSSLIASSIRHFPIYSHLTFSSFLLIYNKQITVRQLKLKENRRKEKKRKEIEELPRRESNFVLKCLEQIVLLHKNAGNDIVPIFRFEYIGKVFFDF